MRLMLLRHGETDWNREGRLQGHDNSRLSPLGIEQARSMRSALQALRPARIITSDLGRALETCDVLGYQNAIPERRLREIGMGVWTGCRKADLRTENAQNYVDWRRGVYTPPQGEKWSDFKNRVYACLIEWMDRTDGDLLAVVHSGVIRAACDSFLGLNPGKIMPLAQGTLTTFIVTPDHGMSLESYNLHPPSYWSNESTHQPVLFRVTPSQKTVNSVEDT